MLDGSKQRFQTRLVYLFAAMATFGVLPFAILRYLDGEYLKAVIDVLIVCAAAMNAFFAWRTHRIAEASFFAAILYSGGTLAVLYLNSPMYFFWLFPAISANFFLLRAGPAIAVNALLIVASLPLAMRLDDSIAGAGMIVSATFAGCMTYVFARLTEKQQALLERFASEDALTGLANRRMLDIEMRRCIQDFNRSGVPASVIVLDIDNFKTVNDLWGHQHGDELLINISRVLSARTRKTDRIFRFGGEEFVIIARSTTLDGARKVAEELREQIAAHLHHNDQEITASFGCAQLQTNETARNWFDRADQAMYVAKKQGKNRVAVAGY